jgi:Na+/proline symporter
MKLSTTDYAVIVLFFAANLGIGLYYARRGGKSVSEFFLSGRGVPWWLAGISMVATTFAADTPLAVTGFVTQHGIAGNWVWWSSVMSGILTVFFFAKLWRRSGVLTDVEFIEIRYSGRPAAALRLVRALFQGVLVNTIVMGWVNLAMAKILALTLHVPKLEALAVCLIFTGVYVTLGGLWGVLVTDLLQFVVKMSMAIVLAVAAVTAVGGIGTLTAKLTMLDAAHHAAANSGGVLAFFPSTNQAWLPLLTFVTYIAVQWWASSYPGAEPGGGGYIAQRIFSARSENDALGATLFFNIAHYALRPWPWILVALCTLVLYPHGVAGADGKIDPELGYVQAMIDYLPAWARGLMMAGFLAAYMSTMGTHLNLGASYLTSDLYRRFLNPRASEEHYVLASRIATLIVMVLAMLGAYAMSSVGDAWKYLFNLTAGVGARDDPALVLVAGQRMERDNGAAHLRARLQRDHLSARLSLERSQRRREDAAHHRPDHDGGMDRGHLPHQTRAARKTPEFLRARSSQFSGLEADRRARPRGRRNGSAGRRPHRVDRRLRARLRSAVRHREARAGRADRRLDLAGVFGGMRCDHLLLPRFHEEHRQTHIRHRKSPLTDLGLMAHYRSFVLTCRAERSVVCKEITLFCSTR